MRREKNILIQTIRPFECFCIARDRGTAAGITYIYYVRRHRLNCNGHNEQSTRRRFACRETSIIQSTQSGEEATMSRQDISGDRQLPVQLCS